MPGEVRVIQGEVVWARGNVLVGRPAPGSVWIQFWIHNRLLFSVKKENALGMCAAIERAMGDGEVSSAIPEVDLYDGCAL